ncbi:MAG: hypothetical protein V1873_03340 [Verrucomicrobiota bacterium]
MNSLKALAAIVCGVIIVTSAWAQTGEVYSLNVVGFQKVSVKDASKPYTMSSTPFLATNANINQVIGPQLYGSNTFDNSDDILVWIATNQQYKKYYLLGNVGDTNYNNKWIDYTTGEVATNANITPGMGFWVRGRAAVTQTVVFAGDVVDAAAVTNPVITGYQILAYPYSTAIGINQMAFTNQGFGSNTYDNSDNLMLWIPTDQQYKKFYLLGNVGDTNYNNRWIDYTAGAVATNVVPPGQAFWYRHRGSPFNWVETKPYTVP